MIECSLADCLAESVSVIEAFFLSFVSNGFDVAFFNS